MHSHKFRQGFAYVFNFKTVCLLKTEIILFLDLDNFHMDINIQNHVVTIIIDLQMFHIILKK